MCSSDLAEELDPGSAARHGNLGTALMMAGRTKEAIAEYEVRARIDDGDARAHSDLGTALLATQDLERATAESYLFATPPKGAGDGSKLELPKLKSLSDRTIELK